MWQSCSPGFHYPMALHPGALSQEKSLALSARVSSDNSFLSVRQEPRFGPWKGSPVLRQGYQSVHWDFPELIWHASKVMLKILQARLQQYVNHELPDAQAGFRKGRGTRDQSANICWIIKQARVPGKHRFLLYWLCQSLWLCGSQ